MIEERRENPRVKVCHPCLFLTRISPSPRFASTVDLSLGGVRIATRHCLISDQMIDLAIAIRGRVIICRGRVVYVLIDVDGPMAGIRFEAIPRHDRLYLEGHISGLLEQKNEIRLSRPN